MFSESIARKGINSAWENAIKLSSNNYSIETDLIKAIISTESGWNPGAVNPADPSYGLMQINTRAHPDVTPQQMLVPEQNIDYGTAYLREQSNRFGTDLAKVISSYNAGHPISGNLPYVQEVLQYYEWFKQNDLNIVDQSNSVPADGSGFPKQKDIWIIVGAIIGALILASVFSR